MNNILLQWGMLDISHGAGGLFDFNATLFLMILQFILLTIFLKILFYDRIAKIFEEREIVINTNLNTASKNLLKADELCNLYDGMIEFAYSIVLEKINDNEKQTKESTIQLIEKQIAGFQYLNALSNVVIPVEEFTNELQFRYLIFLGLNPGLLDYLIPLIIQKFNWMGPLKQKEN